MTGFIAVVNNANALLVDLLPITSVWPFRGVCRPTWSAIKPYLVALRFATTRLNAGSLPLSLGKWFEVWNACALVVEKCGIDASVWAHAIEWDHSSECKCRVAEFASEVTHHSSVAWILSFTGCYSYQCSFTQEVDLDAFVILSDGQFAVISGMTQMSYNGQEGVFDEDEVYAYFETSIRVSNTVAAALSDDWYVDLGGRFKARCAHHFWPGPSEMIRTLWACWVAQGQVIRYALDGIWYSQEEFWEHYVESKGVNFFDVDIGLFQRRWEEATPSDTRADQFAGMISKHCVALVSNRAALVSNREH